MRSSIGRVAVSKTEGWGFNSRPGYHLFFPKGKPHAKSKKSGLTIEGKTSDGKLVVSGIFKMVSSTIGLPLEFLLEIIDKNNMVISWTHFIEESLKSGWKWKTIENRIEYSVKEVYDKEYCSEVMKRINLYKCRCSSVDRAAHLN